MSGYARGRGTGVCAHIAIIEVSAIESVSTKQVDRIGEHNLGGGKDSKSDEMDEPSHRRAPTSPMSPSACGSGGAARLAVQEYLDGERLCDAGDVAQGIKKLRRAISAEPDLDKDEWPAWAEKLRIGLERAAMRPPPHAIADLDLNGAPLSDEQAAQLVVGRGMLM